MSGGSGTCRFRSELYVINLSDSRYCWGAKGFNEDEKGLQQVGQGRVERERDPGGEGTWPEVEALPPSDGRCHQDSLKLWDGGRQPGHREERVRVGARVAW